MANEIRTSYTSGSNLYVQVRRPSDLYRFNGTAFEAYNASNWTTYAIALTEQGSTGEYAGTFPALITSLGVYDIIFFKRLAGTPATSDTKLSQGGNLNWDGTAEVSNVDLLENFDGGNVTITSANPVSQSLAIAIIRGDDYDADEGRALEWSTTSADTWPTLTGAAIAFTASLNPNNETAGDATLTAAGTVVTGTGANKLVRVELPSASTDTLAIGTFAYNYDVQATLTNGHKVTLATGTMAVREDYTS